ncbi:DNA starvation/stationary phase protection protein DpsA [Haloarcula salinisoli]|uniref:DNA starvation/stationary phase protection protein n=1 Tax=Haloarcula salinisoli TaxID=2487746 RepID=A0A8J7YH18_9EURY|nr:DNA starvation/stationary phase protection protein DpsA [Halomicroarcula salinisoli]MBX0285371.1 DNA starvation/stationary phase protection protein [Halomicroarcula salinisoli]MBX0303151.1 DNA starvation/stationary phase protection protein [Halomicroarcula salinisoli]
MATQEHVSREFGTVEENDLRLDVEKSEQIIDALNQDLANVYVLYHQVKKHHWNVEGAEFRDLHLFLGDAAMNLEEAADELAERAQALGGTPISGPAAQEEHASVDYEGQDIYNIRTSLEHDLEVYGDIIEATRDHIELAENLGDHATAQILREILVQTEEDAHHIEHYLAGDTLVMD